MSDTGLIRCGVACLLGLCLLLGGCQGFVGSEETAPDTATVTPAPVPEQATGGVSADAVDADRLAETHREVLSRTNYTLTLTDRLVIDGEQRRVTTRRRQVAPGALEYLVTRSERTDDFAPSNYAGVTGYWYTRSSVLVRYDRDSGRRYAVVNRPGPGLLSDPTEHRTVAGMVRAFDIATVTQREGSDGSVVRADDLSQSGGIPELGYFVAPRNATLQLTVAPRGYVRHYEVAYTATIAGTDRQVRVVRELRVTQVGRTTVASPDWADEAREEAESG